MACPPSANIQLYGSSILHPKGKQWFYIFKYASRKPGIWAAKNPDKIGVFAEHIFFMFLLWRSWRDLNSRAGNPTYTLSRGAPSANLGTTPCYNRIKEISNLAERIGFEPTVPFGITGFQDQLHKPLGHLSKQALPPSIFQCLFIISEKKCFVKIKLPVCRKNRGGVLTDSSKAEASAKFPAFYEKTNDNNRRIF